MSPGPDGAGRRPARRQAAAVAPLMVALVAACQTTVAPGDETGSFEVRRGTIAFYQDPVTIEVADSIAAGAPLGVAVRTYGGGCVFQGYTRTAVAGLEATVEPYDSVYVPGANEVCTLDLRWFTHEGTVTFSAAGAATIRVIGRREPGGSPVTEERGVTVY